MEVFGDNIRSRMLLLTIVFIGSIIIPLGKAILRSWTIVARTAAEDKAIRKYEKEKIDRIMIRVPKGMKEIIQNFASERGESLNGFIQRAVYESMSRDEQKKEE